MQQSIEVQLRMEKGMYGRLVERAKDQGMPLSAVVRDAVVQYFENFPEVADEDLFMPAPDDPIWDIPELSRSYGALRVPASGNGGES